MCAPCVCLFFLVLQARKRLILQDKNKYKVSRDANAAQVRASGQFR
jgi:hypothetical protein